MVAHVAVRAGGISAGSFWNRRERLAPWA